MRPEIAQQYTPELIARAFEDFEITDSKVLSAWHAMTFLGNRRGQPCVVRISHSAHRSIAEIEAEVAWMRELIEIGIEAPVPQRSVRGNYCEALANGESQFTAVAFGELRGKEITDDHWNDRTFQAWGELTGRLHRYSRAVRPNHCRKQWHESDFLNFDRYLSPDDELVRERTRAVVGRLRTRPALSPYYGLIHADIYQDNLRLLENGELEVFDFDNSEYGWFVSDLANALYAALWRVKDPAPRDEFARRFLDQFLHGYERHHVLPSEELKLLPDFLRLREILIYTVGRKQLDPSRLTETQVRMFALRRSRIVTQTPVVNLAL